MKNRREFLKTMTMLSLACGVGFNFANAQSMENLLKSGFKMPKRMLGKDLEVSALAFGMMGLNYHRSKVLSESEAANVVARAVDYGINFFDTAQVYGPNSNEILTGKILTPYKDKVIIATKFGFGSDEKTLDSSKKRIKEVVEQSLKRLNLERLPLLYQHRFDPKTPIEEVALTMQELIKEGKVARWGVCELAAKSIEAAHKVCPLTCVQSEYHLMHKEPEIEILPMLERLNIGFVAYSPLNRGYLSGKFTKNSQFDPNNDNRATFPRYQDDTLKANYQIVELLSEFGKGKMNDKSDASSAQIALAYLLAKKPFIVPLFGTTSLAHLEEDVLSLNVNLTQNDIALLDERLSKIEIKGDRYPPEQANRVGK